MAHLNRILLEEARGVVIDFWGTWCQPCRSLRPHLERLATAHADSWRIVAVHVEENADVIDAYGVQSTPTLVYVRGGNEVHRSTGAVTPSSVEEALQQHG